MLIYASHRLLLLYKAHGLMPTARMVAWKVRVLLGRLKVMRPTWEYWLEDLIPWRGEGFVDVGANTGQWVCLLAKGYRWGLAVEPNPQAWPSLRKRLPPHVGLCTAALWSCHRVGELVLRRESQLATLLSHYECDSANGNPIGKVLVPCLPLDSLQLPRFDFLKVDVEGAEVEVIKGASGTLRRYQPELLIECHSRSSRRWLEQFLPTLGYKLTLRRAPFYAKDDPYYEAHTWLKGVAGRCSKASNS